MKEPRMVPRDFRLVATVKEGRLVCLKPEMREVAPGVYDVKYKFRLLTEKEWTQRN